MAGVTPILSSSKYITAEGGSLLIMIEPVFVWVCNGGFAISFFTGIGGISSVVVLNSHSGHFG